MIGIMLLRGLPVNAETVLGPHSGQSSQPFFEPPSIRESLAARPNRLLQFELSSVIRSA
jgi:hypothetical protein